MNGKKAVMLEVKSRGTDGWRHKLNTLSNDEDYW